MSKPFLVLDTHFMFDALRNHAINDARELNLGELYDFFERYVENPEFAEEIKHIIAENFDYFCDEELDDYRRDILEGQRENDAYEKHRQKQIDEGE